MTEGIAGVVLLDKPPGVTSFQALAAVKSRLGTRRVGHAGTLDRFAEGLLVALVGRATRLVPFAMDMEKEYVATVAFGRQTDTLDPEGVLVAEGPVPVRSDVEAALPGFTGTIQQVPPAYSAIHVEGKRAYQAARRGEEVALSPRQVTVRSLQLLAFDPPHATLQVVCSKGTYVRSLARDIAEALSTCAHLSGLRRVRIGAFRVESAVSPESFDPAVHLLPPARFFDGATGVQAVRLRDEWRLKAGQGLPVQDFFFEEPPRSDGTFAAFGRSGELVAVLEKRGGSYRYAAAFPPEGPT